MSKQKKAAKLISLLNEAEMLAIELNINDSERFNALRFWARLAAYEDTLNLSIEEAL